MVLVLNLVSSLYGGCDIITSDSGKDEKQPMISIGYSYPYLCQLLPQSLLELTQINAYTLIHLTNQNTFTVTFRRQFKYNNESRFRVGM